MSIFEPLRRESVRIKAAFTSIFSPGQEPAKALICPNCERELEPGHTCEAKGLSRRVFFGLLGASSAALAMRIEGVPIPGARIEVIARAGDMFDVATDGSFTVAWMGAVTRGGAAFRADDGVIQSGGILEFNGRELASGEKGLRVHRGLAEMRVLGVRDKATGQPLKYRIIREAVVNERIAALNQKKIEEVLKAYPNTKAVLSVKKEVPVFLNTEPKLVDRSGVGTCSVTFQDGSIFHIRYIADKSSMMRDTVSWTRSPIKLFKRETDKYIPAAEVPLTYSGNLHQAISDLNQWVPDKAELLRKSIMSLNPEYRARTGAVKLQKLETPDYAAIANTQKLKAEDELRERRSVARGRINRNRRIGPRAGQLPA